MVINLFTFHFFRRVIVCVRYGINYARHSLRKMVAGISFFMVSSSDLKYKLWLSTHYFSGFLQDWFHVFLYEIKKKSVWYNFFQGTSVSITFYIFEHYQLWMMDSKAQRVFFPKIHKLCVWHTEVRNCYHFKLVSHFQLWFPIWGALVNRLKKPKGLSVALYFSKQLWHCLKVLHSPWTFSSTEGASSIQFNVLWVWCSKKTQTLGVFVLFLQALCKDLFVSPSTSKYDALRG